MSDSGCKGDGNGLVYETGVVTSVSRGYAADESPQWKHCSSSHLKQPCSVINLVIIQSLGALFITHRNIYVRDHGYTLSYYLFPSYFAHEFKLKHLTSGTGSVNRVNSFSWALSLVAAQRASGWWCHVRPKHIVAHCRRGGWGSLTCSRQRGIRQPCRATRCPSGCSHTITPRMNAAMVRCSAWGGDINP